MPTLLPARTLPATLLGALGACLALGFSSSVQAPDRTVTVTEQVRIGITPERAWTAIENFMTWPSWHPAFASDRLLKGDGHSVGSVRLLVAKDGARFTEELIAHDAAARSLQYRILESPAPVVGYHSTLAVKPYRGGSTVVWSSEFKVAPGASEDAVKKLIAGIYRQGLDNLAGAIE
jgi:hypothetical protein